LNLSVATYHYGGFVRYNNVNLIPVPYKEIEALNLMEECLTDNGGVVSAQHMHDILEEWVMDSMSSEYTEDALIDDLFICLSWIHENAPYKNDVLCYVHHIFL